MSDDRRWFGKFRGVVVDTNDPERLGRLRAMVPDVLGTVPSTWAMPCVPAAAPQMGIVAIPSAGAGVWVEFEQGDPDYPVSVGGWWGSPGEMPAEAQAGPDGSSVIVLRIAGGAVITVSDSAVTIANGRGASIELVGPTISFNAGAMTIP